MKKFVSVLLVCVALVLVLDVNGTLANQAEQMFNGIYRTLTDLLGGNGTPDTGVTLDVALSFKQRGTDGNTLVAETNKPVLYPVGYEDAWPTDTRQETIGGVDYSFWDVSKIPGVLEKFVSVKNEATDRAYFRLAIAVKNTDVAQRVLKVNISTNHPNYDYYTRPIEIDGEAFVLHLFTYKGELEATQESSPVGLQVALDSSTTNDDLEALGGDFLQIKVMAIQADVFTKTENNKTVQMSYSEALEAALPIESTNPFQ